MTTQTQMCKCGKQYLYVPITLDGEQCHVKVCPDAVDLYVGCEPQDEPQTETDGWIDDLEKKATGRPLIGQSDPQGRRCSGCGTLLNQRWRSPECSGCKDTRKAGVPRTVGVCIKCGDQCKADFATCPKCYQPRR